jgi:hypothetical protein
MFAAEGMLDTGLVNQSGIRLQVVSKTGLRICGIDLGKNSGASQSDQSVENEGHDDQANNADRDHEKSPLHGEIEQIQSRLWLSLLRRGSAIGGGLLAIFEISDSDTWPSAWDVVSEKTDPDHQAILMFHQGPLGEQSSFNRSDGLIHGTVPKGLWLVVPEV